MAKYEVECRLIDVKHDIKKNLLRFDESVMSASMMAASMFDIEISRIAAKQAAWFASLGYKVRVK